MAGPVPKKTPAERRAERGVKRPSKADKAAAKALPESLIPTRHSELDEFSLAYERLAIQIGFEINNFDGCAMDHAAALYTVFAAICAQLHAPTMLVFHDLADMGNRGELKGFMQE